MSSSRHALIWGHSIRGKGIPNHPPLGFGCVAIPRSPFDALKTNG